MFTFIADLSEGYALDFTDDGTPSAPILRTIYTAAALQNARVLLAKVQSSIDVVISSWARGDRCDKFDIHERSGRGLIDLVNASRSLYAIAGTLVYSDQVWRHGPWPTSQATPHLHLLDRANAHREHRIYVGGARIVELEELQAAASDELMGVAGFHDVGTRSGNNVLSFSDDNLDEDLLMQIHDEAADALDLCMMRRAELNTLRDLRMSIGDYTDSWDRVWNDIYFHHPVPFGVEPGGAYRVGVSSFAA